MFNYFKPKLVQFGNGKFGILKRKFFGYECYLGDDITWWSVQEYVEKYCHFDNADDALDAFAKEQAFKKKSKYVVISELNDDWDVV